MPSPTRVFRKAALDRLSTPEQLDQLVQVTSVRSWVLLGALLLFVAALAGWGIFGTVTTRVQAQGILLGGGVYDVVPLTAGQLRRIAIRAGDTVHAGQVVAEVSQAEVAQQLADARSRLAELQAQHRELESFGSEDIRLQTGFVDQRRRTLEQQIQSGQARVAFLEQQAQSEESLAQQGLITRRQLAATQQAASETRDEVERAKAELSQLSSQALSARFTRQQQLDASQRSIAETERLIAQLETEYASRSRVISPYSGRVLEVMADEGGLVSPGVPIMKLGRAGGGAEPMRAVLYVPTADGKKVAPGMPIEVAPSTVKPEEYGFIEGRVTRVAEFPATTQGMMHVLKNDQLVGQLARTGAPFELAAELLPDAKTPSGFRWTSSRGPDLQIRGGTPAAAWITVERQRPVSLVIPALRKLVTPSVPEAAAEPRP